MTVTLGGLELTIFPRLALDVIRLAEASRERAAKGIAQTDATLLYEYCIILHSSLKRNAEGLPWYKFFRRRRIFRLTSVENIVSTLSMQQISDLVLDVLKAEGLSNDDLDSMKKKVTPKKE